MNLITATAVGAAVLVFGPGFLVNAAVGYVAGTVCGCYAEKHMKRLHREICRRTGDDSTRIGTLAKYAADASQIGGALCPIIPLVSAGVGLYCSKAADEVGAMSVPEDHSEPVVRL